METTDHQQPCACGDCRNQRREAALTAAKELPSARRSAAACSPRVLAREIAGRLFMNAFGDRGTRLEIKQGNGQEPERSLGGWCLEAAVDQIADILEENREL
jgi:hypothetical protein